MCIQRSGLPVGYSAGGVFGFLFFLGQFFSFQFVFCESCFGFGNFLFHLASFCSSIDCSLFLSAASIGGVFRVNSSVFSEFLCVIERRLIQILNAAIDDLGQRAGVAIVIQLNDSSVHTVPRIQFVLFELRCQVLGVFDLLTAEAALGEHETVL